MLRPLRHALVHAWRYFPLNPGHAFVHKSKSAHSISHDSLKTQRATDVKETKQQKAEYTHRSQSPLFKGTLCLLVGAKFIVNPFVLPGKPSGQVRCWEMGSQHSWREVLLSWPSHGRRVKVWAERQKRKRTKGRVDTKWLQSSLHKKSITLRSAPAQSSFVRMIKVSSSCKASFLSHS